MTISLEEPRPRVRPRPLSHTTSVVDIDAALLDPNLLGAALGEPRTWSTWLTVLRASAGLPLDAKQRETFANIAGNRPPPTRPVRELWCVCGRSAGKSRTAAATAVHTALLRRHHLAPGEVGHVLVLSPTVAQSRIIFGYAEAFIRASPVLRHELIDSTQNELRLRGNIVIGTHPNSFRSVRGRHILAVIFEESSYWRDETSAVPDVEVYGAILPSLIRSGGQLIGISTPYRKVGLLYQKHYDHYGVDDPDVLVVQGDSRTFNPTLSKAAIAKAMAADPEAGLSEWAAEFRTDIAAFLSDADIDACTDHGRPMELPPRGNHRGFVNSSGGRHDAMTVAIAHRDGERTVIDVLRGVQPPFDPKAVTAEFSELLKDYDITEVTGDNYSANWVEGAFKACGVRYIRSELPKGRLYIDGLPAFTRRVVSFPAIGKLLRELRLLERRTHTGGKDSVDHGRSGSDDYANSLFGVLSLLAKPKPRIVTMSMSGDGFGPGQLVDPTTMKPLGISPSRINFVNVNEAGDVLRTRRVSNAQQTNQ